MWAAALLLKSIGKSVSVTAASGSAVSDVFRRCDLNDLR